VECRWASDHGLLLTFRGASRADVRARVHAATAAIAGAAIPALVNLHPASSSVLAVCDPRRVDPAAFEAAVRAAAATAAPIPPSRAVVEIPVCYDAAFAPDLEDVARNAGVTSLEVVARHAAAEYVVAFLGFAPGFPYLDGLPAELAMPRLPTPRRRVEAGSVAIGGEHAGIYPAAMPGGWRVIGRTPLRLFDVEREPMALLAPGDRVRFHPVGADALRSGEAR
jgi:KipI family sensor histidine kinase inhibitor